MTAVNLQFARIQRVHGYKEKVMEVKSRTAIQFAAMNHNVHLLITDAAPPLRPFLAYFDTY